MERDRTGTRRSWLASPLLWAAVVVMLLGLAFNFGLFFVPITEVIRSPELVPMPEALVGWWVAGIGILMLVWSLFRNGRR